MAGGTGRSPLGEIFLKRTKTKSERIQHARHPCDESTGGGGSKTPTANHRRPLPLWKRLCGRQLGQSLAKLSGQLFPESVWKDFGERVGEQEEEPWGPLGASWVPLWPSQGVPDLSNAVGSRLRGLSEPTWGPLGALQGRLGGHLRRLGGLLGRLGALSGPSWGPLGP